MYIENNVYSELLFTEDGKRKSLQDFTIDIGDNNHKV